MSLLADRAFTALCWALATLGLMLPVGIVVFLAVRGLSVLSLGFLIDAPAGLPLGAGGGIGPAILGSLALVVIGAVIAVPLGVGGAIYLSEYDPPRLLARAARFAAECLAAVPSIVYGLFGYAFLVVFMALKVSLLAGGLTLGIVMLPIILIGAQEALKSVEGSQREAALSLGVTTAHALRRIVIRRATPGICAVTVLALGHAFGTAAPILFTAATIFSRGDIGLSTPVMTLPTHLYYLTGEAVSFDHAYATGFVIVVILLVANLAALALKARVGRD